MVQKPVWNSAIRVNHQHSVRMTHPHSNRNVVPIAVLTRSRLVSLNAARPVPTAVPQSTVKSPRPVKHVVNKAHSPIRRPINHRPATKHSNFNKQVTTIKVNKVNDVQGIKGNAEKASTNWDNPQQALNDKGVIDSVCLRHMTRNISYLLDFEEINGGYVAFRGNPKGGKISGKDKVVKETVSAQQYVLLLLWSTSSQDPHNTDADVNDDAFDVKENENDVHVLTTGSDKSDNKKHDEKDKRDAKGKSPVDSPTTIRDLRAEFEEFSSNSTNRVNAVSAPVTAVGPNLTNSTNSFNTASPSINTVSPTFRVAKKSSFVDPSKYPDDPDMPELEDIIYSNNKKDVGVEADLSNLETNIHVSLILTTRVYKDHHVNQIIGDLNSAPQIRNLPKGKRAIGSKWVFRNKKDERRIVIRNKSKLVTHRHTQEEGIEYDEVFAPVARIESIRLFLAYASFMGFMVYQMDVKSDFLYETIEKEVYVYQPLGFEDLDYPDKVYKVVKALYGLHQAPRAWITSKAKGDGIFISQDKYVAKILRKFGFTDVKSASTPIETEKPLLKDPDGVNTPRCDEDSIEHMELMVFHGTNLMRKMELKLLPVNDVVQLCVLIDGKKVVFSKDVIRSDIHLDDAHGVECLPNEEIFAKLARMGYEKPHPKLTFYKAFFYAQWKFLIHTLEQPATTSGSSMSLLTTLMEICATLSKKVAELEQDKHTQALDILKLKKRVNKLEKKKRSKSLGFKRLRNVEAVIMDAEPQGMIDQDEINVASKGVNAVELTVFDDEEVTMTLAQTLIKIKAEKAKLLDEQIAQKLHDGEVLKAEVSKSQEEACLHSSSQEKYDNLFEEYGWYKMEHFRGMTYDKVRPIFEREYKKVQTLFKPDKDVDEPKKKRVAEETML
nr:copia protein [Tanacetum cinerariifolium]